jgi:hypothetical protein
MANASSRIGRNRAPAGRGEQASRGCSSLSRHGQSSPGWCPSSSV